MKLIDISVVCNFDLYTLILLLKRFREDFYAHYFIKNYYNTQIYRFGLFQKKKKLCNYKLEYE